MSNAHETDPFDLQALSSQGAAQNAEAKRKRAEYLEAVRFLLSDRRGLRFLRVLLGRADVLKSPLYADPYEAAFRAGARSLGLEVLEDMTEVDPTSFVKMRIEE